MQTRRKWPKRGDRSSEPASCQSMLAKPAETSCGHAQHLRLRVERHDLGDERRKGARELAGAAAEVHDAVAGPQLAELGDAGDQARRVGRAAGEVVLRRGAEAPLFERDWHHRHPACYNRCGRRSRDNPAHRRSSLWQACKASRSFAHAEPGMPRIVVAGGGAAGLELVTKLGDTLGRRKQARITLVERDAHASVEAAAAFGRRRQPVAAGARAELSGAGALAPFHLPLRRGDRPRPRRPSGCMLAATHDEEGREITPASSAALRHAGHGDRQHHQRFRHAGRRRVRGAAGDRRAGEPVQPPAGQRLPARQSPGRAGAAGPAARRDHRRRRDGDRTGGRTAPHGPRRRRLRHGPHRPGARHPHRADRGGAAHPAGAAGADLRGDRRSCCSRWVSRCAPARGWPRCARTAWCWRTASSLRPSWWSGRPG